MPGSTTQSNILLAVFFGCSLLFGVARIEIFLQNEAARSLAPFVGKDRTVEGWVVHDPERRETSLHVYLEVAVLDGKEVSGTLLATLPREAQLSYGDQVRLSGDLVLPEVFETDTGRLFDYPNYLRVRGVSALMRYAKIEESTPASWSVKGMLFSIKHEFEHSLHLLLPEPDASLMEGILLGERRGIPEDLNQALIVVGLIHIVVLSGYNISIVAEQVLRFFGLFLSRKAALTVGAVAIVLFALMVGAGATVVRASIMGLIAILARVLMRPAAALRALFLAATAMVLWNPAVLFHDPSFILSVLATFGLITLSPLIEQKITKVPERFGLRSIIASTIAVQIYLLPALLYMTGVLSPFALVGNALVLPFVPLLMLAGFVAGALGLIHSVLGLPFAVITHALVGWVIGVAHTVAALPLSSATIAAFPLWVAVGVYIPLTLFAIYSYRSSLREIKTSGVG